MSKLAVSMYVLFAPAHFRYPCLLFAFPGNYPPSLSTEIQCKTFVTLGISTSVIISDLEPIASAIVFPKILFSFRKLSNGDCKVSFKVDRLPMFAIHMRTRYSESQAVALLVT